MKLNVTCSLSPVISLTKGMSATHKHAAPMLPYVLTHLALIAISCCCHFASAAVISAIKHNTKHQNMSNCSWS